MNPKIIDKAKNSMLTKIEPIIREAGVLLKNRFKQGAKNISQKTPLNFVTDSDKEIQDFLVAELGGVNAEYGFLCEEDNYKILGKEYTWVIDPIDGTNNFIHQLPYVAISVALVKDRKPVLGVVYNPITEQYFAAEKNCGSFLNEKRLKVSERNDLANTMIGTDWTRDIYEKPEMVKVLGFLSKNTQAVRRQGSTALDICQVANGILDAYLCYNYYPWDILASSIILTEAGGVITTPWDTPFHDGETALFANQGIHKELVHYMGPILQEMKKIRGAIDY